MSDDGHESSRGRRGSRRNWLSLAGWAVAALLLLHFLWGNVNREGDRPQSPLSENALRAVAFWVPLLAAVAACACGTWWSWRAYARREKGSVLWMRNAFLTGLGAALALAVAAQDARHFPREWFVAVAAALLAAVTSVFAYAAYREEKRTSSGSSSSHRSSSRSHAAAGSESER